MWYADGGIQPLSVELYSDESAHKRRKSWKGWARTPSQKKWRYVSVIAPHSLLTDAPIIRTFANIPRPGPHSQEGQVTVFVAMPTPPTTRRASYEAREIAIGTRPVIYTSTVSEEKRPHRTPSTVTSSPRLKKGDRGVTTTVVPVSESSAGAGLRESTASSVEVPIHMELCMRGFI